MGFFELIQNDFHLRVVDLPHGYGRILEHCGKLEQIVVQLASGGDALGDVFDGSFENPLTKLRIKTCTHVDAAIKRFAVPGFKNGFIGSYLGRMIHFGKNGLAHFGGKVHLLPDIIYLLQHFIGVVETKHVRQGFVHLQIFAFGQ